MSGARRIIDQTAREAVRAAVRGTVRFDEPMAPRTSWRVGGPAALWVAPADEEDLRAAIAAFGAHGIPWVVLGKGSNTLFADAGYAGAVVSLEEGFADLRHVPNGLGEGEHALVAGGGAAISAVLHYVVRERLQGMELWAGIPGTVGGAVRMNAGTHLGETKDVLVDATLLLETGEVVTRTNADLAFAYRASNVADGQVILGATFRVRTAQDATFAREIQEVKERRRRTQPLTLPNGGSTFANPPGDHAWRLIDAAGLRGKRHGDAEISTVHPNFIVNLGSASAADISALIELAESEVFQRSGVRLRPEVVRLGDWGDEESGE